MFLIGAATRFHMNVQGLCITGLNGCRALERDLALLLTGVALKSVAAQWSWPWWWEYECGRLTAERVTHFPWVRHRDNDSLPHLGLLLPLAVKEAVHREVGWEG